MSALCQGLCRPPWVRGSFETTKTYVQHHEANESSASAAWLLGNAGSLEKVYCRLPLLLSTLEKRAPGIFHCTSEPELKNKAGVDPRDGMAECSLAFAQRYGLVSAVDCSQRRLQALAVPWARQV